MDVPLFFKRKKCRSWEVLQQKNMVQHIMFVKLFFYNQNLGYQIMRMMILRKDRKKYGVMKESVEKTIYFKGG